jgi:hypothetical protein
MTMLVVTACASVVTQAGWREDIGLDRLQARLGKTTPTGAAVSVSQVEMCVQGSDYVPDRRNGSFVGKSINVRSGDGGFSTHATTVSQYYFGVGSSPALGIRSADIYEANGWINSILRVSSGLEPGAEPRQIENHSWVGSLGTTVMDADALRRVDFLVQRDGVLIAAGLNNGSTTPVPRLVCSAYNIVTVGLTNGDASRGATSIEGNGRVKPDLVAPLSATSWATPVVAASGALLLEAEDEAGALADLPVLRLRPARALLAKALLMGGATKTEWRDWRKGLATPCTDGSVPLDYRYGAGELNIDNSYRILSAGRHAASQSVVVPTTGWDYGHAVESRPQRYFFEVTSGRRVVRASILAVWNRRIEVSAGTPLKFKATLPNIDLRLCSAAGFVPASIIDASTSRVDNVEHLYFTDLAAGRYAIDVQTDQESDYCLTWDVEFAPEQPAVVVIAR